MSPKALRRAQHVTSIIIFITLKNMLITKQL
uniref:Uncharacterized protein n=1 Tax=Tetranychus urticae TaxID=32264 RepID=T1K181_TETUR